MRALVAVENPKDLQDVTRGLRASGVTLVVGAGAEQATRLATRSHPDVAILVNEVTNAEGLVKVLEDRQIPVVLVGSPDQLARAAGIRTVVAGVPSPPHPSEILRAIESAVGDSVVADGRDVISVGEVRIDMHARLVFLGARQIELPPKEFAVLAELASNVGTPVSSAQLLRRVWPDADGITTDDVHRHVYRLRSMLDDHARIPPLIANRRGFGYVFADRRSDAVVNS